MLKNQFCTFHLYAPVFCKTIIHLPQHESTSKSQKTREKMFPLYYWDSGDWQTTHKEFLKTYFTLHSIHFYLPTEKLLHAFGQFALACLGCVSVMFSYFVIAVLLYYKVFFSLSYLRFAPSFLILRLNRWIGRHARRQQHGTATTTTGQQTHQHIKKQQTETREKIKLFINHM